MRRKEHFVCYHYFREQYISEKARLGPQEESSIKRVATFSPRPAESICSSCRGRKKRVTVHRIAEQQPFPHEPHLTWEQNGISYKLAKGQSLQSCILFKDDLNMKKKIKTLTERVSITAKSKYEHILKGLAVLIFFNFCG